MNTEPTAQPKSGRPRDWDRALKDFLEATNRREAETRMAWLHREFFSVVISQVLTEELRRGVPASAAELAETQESFTDISLMIHAKIAGRLWSLKDQATPNESIKSLYAYVVAVAKNACVDYLRRKYPGRHALDNSLRAALKIRPALALWRTQIAGDIQEWRCGRAEWQAEKRTVRTLSGDNVLQQKLAFAIRDLNYGEALPQIFELTQAPLRFIELLSFLSEIWDVEAPHRLAEQEYVPFRVPKPYQFGFQPEEIVSLIGMLQTIWQRTRMLSSLQAATLLLKLPEFEDGSYINALVRFNITTWPSLAKTMGIALDKLKTIADDAPLEDTQIAEVLGLTPDEVPRVRQDARRRLKRQNVQRQESLEK